jgi:hypothetical protein
MAQKVTVALSVEFDMEDIAEFLVEIAGLKEENITQADIIEVANDWAVDHFYEHNTEDMFTVAIDGEVVS